MNAVHYPMDAAIRMSYFWPFSMRCLEFTLSMCYIVLLSSVWNVECKFLRIQVLPLVKARDPANFLVKNVRTDVTERYVPTRRQPVSETSRLDSWGRRFTGEEFSLIV